MPAKEILQMRNEGQDVPNEYQKWAAAVSAIMDVQDEVTYEMVNGETDIAALDEALGRELDMPEVEAADETENNIGNETDRRQETPPEERDDITLADESITTDPNEILKRKQRKGIQPLS